jgi:hypothetical protein
MNIKLNKLEIRTLKKLDGLFIESATKKEPQTKGVKSEVPAENTKGVRALLQGFSATAKAHEEREKAKTKNG